MDTLIHFFAFSSDIIYGLLGKIFWFGLIPISGWLLWLVGQGIDFALNLTLHNEFFTSEAINVTWGIIRDLCNMAFIFVLIWAGLKTILNLSDVNVKKTIINVVIAAIFINFSLFMTKAIIDVSNVATAWFVQGIENVGGGTGVSDSVRAALQMDKLTQNKDAGRGAMTLASFVSGFALFAINCVAIYVFFQVVFFLIARIVSFVFLLVTSPVAFMGTLEIPELKKFSDEWWKELQCQAMMAPMFFLMLYITLYVVDSINSIAFGTATLVQDTVTGSAFNPTNYVMFAIIIFMLQKCLSVAEEYGCTMGKQVAGYLKSVATLATGSIAMGTIGKGATALQNSKSFQSWAARSGVVGEYTMRAAAGTANAGFGVASSFKDLNKATGDLGPKNAFKGTDKGYSGKIDQEKKDDKEFAKMLGKGAVGARNRQAYAAGMAQGGILGRTMRAAGTAVGGTIGSVGGPLGIAAGAALGERAASRILRGATTGAEDVKKDADKELKKEEAKETKDRITQEIKELEEGSKNKDGSQKETGINTLNQNLINLQGMVSATAKLALIEAEQYKAQERATAAAIENTKTSKSNSLSITEQAKFEADKAKKLKEQEEALKDIQSNLASAMGTVQKAAPIVAVQLSELWRKQDLLKTKKEELGNVNKKIEKQKEEERDENLAKVATNLAKSAEEPKPQEAPKGK